MSETSDHQVGAHSVLLVEPDIYIVRQVGEITAHEIATILDRVDEFIVGKTAVFALIDQTRAVNMPSDARRVLLSRMSSAVVGVVFINVPLVARVGISLGYKAYLMMSRGQDVAHAFVDNEVEARAWVAERRKLAATRRRT